MCLQYLGLTLLVALPGVLHAQNPAEPCVAPKLSSGYLVPDNEIYAHDTKLTYACDMGYRPVVEGWWATITCQKGSWSHVPQCINVTACFPPEIANGNYAESSNGWYKDEHKLRIKCDEGYEHKDNVATTKCTNGQWSSLPVCQKSADSCDAPEISHAVIIGEGYKEVFAANSFLQYECEDGYTAEGAEKKLICIAGAWSGGPPCSKRPEPGTEQGGSAEVRPSDRHTSSTRRETQPAGKRPEPGTEQGGSAEVRPSDRHTSSTRRETQPAVTGCVMQAGTYNGHNLIISLRQDVILKEGEWELGCDWPDFKSRVWCNNGRWTITPCCHPHDRSRGICPHQPVYVVRRD